MMKVNYYKCRECWKKFKTLNGWGSHMDAMHPGLRPSDYSYSRYFYYVVTGKTHGICRTCKKDTKWNENSMKYDQYCENPECKQIYSKMAKDRMMKKYGKLHLLNDPEVQKKMLSNRKISGKYTFKDGTSFEYVGSYERAFLEMLDTLFEWHSSDLIAPSPHVYRYDYRNPKDDPKNEGSKFYIPDFYIPSLNLEIEIKQQTSGNQKMNEINRVKEKLKDEVMLSNPSINYLKINDNNFTNFFEFLEKAKEYIPTKVESESKKNELVVESYLDDEMITMEEAQYSKENKFPVFLLLMHSGSPLSTIIKTLTRNEYSHACISFNSKLEPIYSFNGKFKRDGSSPFTIRMIDDPHFLKYHPTYSLYVMYVNKKNYDKMKERLQYFIDNRDELEYDFLNLFSVLIGRESEKSNKWFCSKFVMSVLGTGRNNLKVPSLYKPQDIAEFEDVTLVNKGDDLCAYDYQLTDKNLKKIKQGKFNEIVVESSKQYGLKSNIMFFDESSFDSMRDATPEEKESVHNYYDSISTSTGVNFFDAIESLSDSKSSTEYDSKFFNSSIDKNFKSKGNLKLSKYKRIEIDKRFMKTYSTPMKERYYRPSDRKNDYYSCAWLDGTEVVGTLGIEFHHDDGHNWITSLEVTPKYRGYGLSKEILDYAIELGATAIGVYPSNKVALKLYESKGFKISEDSLNEVSRDKTKSYRMYLATSHANESYTNNQLLKAHRLNKEMNSWDYGVLINGEKQVDNDDVDWTQYRTIPTALVRSKQVGVCWDFVNYEAEWFQKNGFKFKTFYIQIDDNNMCPSHTFLVFESNGKYYYFESAWFKYQGIKEFRSYEDAFYYVCNNHNQEYNPNLKYKSYAWEYNTKGMDNHLSTNEFMTKIFKGGNEIKVDKKSLESFIEYCNEMGIAEEGLLSFLKPRAEKNDFDRESWRSVFNLNKGLFGRGVLGGGIFLGVTIQNGFIEIKGINFNLLKSRIKRFYDDKSINNIFLPKYNALSYRRFEKKKIQRSDIKIEYLYTPEFFALELVSLFTDLGRRYRDTVYISMASYIYNNSWLKEADNKAESVPLLDTSKLSNLKLTLNGYQKDFIEKYPKLKAQLNLNGYILAFEQGLGKTLTAIALSECLDVDHVYIVCPNSLKENWALEIKKYYEKYDKDDDMWRQEVFICSDKDIYFNENTTKFMIINNESIPKMYPYVMSGKNMMILDESHNMRNLKSKRVGEILKLRDMLKCTDTLVMSGTPIKATPDEIVPALLMIDPTFTMEAAEIFAKAFKLQSSIGTSLVQSRFGKIMYRKEKDVLEDKLPEKHVLPMTVQIKDGKKYTMDAVNALVMNRFSMIYDEGLAEVKKMKQPFFEISRKYTKPNEDFNRFKALILTVTGKTEYLHEIDQMFMENHMKTITERIRNREERNQYIFLIKNFVRYRAHCLGVAFGQILPKYRKDMFIAMYDENKSKFISMIKENPKKSLIFSQFKDVINYIIKDLNENGIGAVCITGDVKNRMEILREFKENDNVMVLVATSQTIGTGVTLTEASQMFFFGQPWRDADFEQCSDRIHRIGQTDEVFIYTVSLDTGGELNLSTRMDDIISWSKKMTSAVINTTQDDANLEENNFEELLTANEGSSYYRVTYNDKGIYNEYKNACSNNDWAKFKNSNLATWLPLPPDYDDDSFSYFTEDGYRKFVSTTLPLFEKKLNRDKIRISKFKNVGNVKYQDKYQVVSNTDMNFVNSTSNCIIISCYAGVGKNYAIEYLRNEGYRVNSIEKYSDFYKKYPTPEKYVEEINRLAEASDVLFIPYFLNMETRYLRGKVKYYTIYPNMSLKTEYIKRFRSLNFTEEQISYLSDNWIEMIKDCKKSGNPIELSRDKYVLDIIKQLIIANESYLIDYGLITESYNSLSDDEKDLLNDFMMKEPSDKFDVYKELPNEVQEKLFSYNEYYHKSVPIANYNIPSGCILESQSVKAPFGSSGKFKDLQFTKLGNSLFSSQTDHKGNAKFVYVNDNGYEYWNIVSIQNIQKGTPLEFNPKIDFASFGDKERF